jgi:type IV pilus assembly protein PilP
VTRLAICLAGTVLLLAGSAALGAVEDAAVKQDAAHDAYNYDPAGKRDPFRPLSLLQEGDTPQHEPLTPLERYEIGQLRLVGVVLQLAPPRAMVEDSAGLGFILTPGTPVGPNGGVVTEIRPREVVVEEWQTDVIGEKHRTEHVLELPADEEPVR